MQPPSQPSAPQSSAPQGGERAPCFTCGALNEPGSYACGACGVSLRLTPPRRPARPAPQLRAPVVRAPAALSANTLDIEIDSPDSIGRLIAGAASPAPEAGWSALQTVDEATDGLAPVSDIEISPLAERAPSIAGRLRDLEVPSSAPSTDILARSSRVSRAPSPLPRQPSLLVLSLCVAASAALGAYLALPHLLGSPPRASEPARLGEGARPGAEPAPREPVTPVDPAVRRMQLSALLAATEARAPRPDALSAAARRAELPLAPEDEALLSTLTREAEALVALAEARRWLDPASDPSAASALDAARARLSLCLKRAPTARALAAAARLAALSGALPEAYQRLSAAADLLSAPGAPSAGGLTLEQLRWAQAAVRLLDPSAPAEEPWALFSALPAAVFESAHHERYAQLAAERAGDGAGARAHHARFTRLLAELPQRPSGVLALRGGLTAPSRPEPETPAERGARAASPQVTSSSSSAAAASSAAASSSAVSSSAAAASSASSTSATTTSSSPESTRAGGARPSGARRAKRVADTPPPKDASFEELMREGESLLERGRVVAARAHFERARAARPASASPVAQLGWCDLAAGAAGRAKGKFREALSLEPQHADALYGLGYAAESLREWAEARQHFERYLTLYPRGAKVRIIQNKLTRMQK